MRTKFALEAEGKLFANALEIITDVHEEPTCLLSCKKNPDWKFFTHYSSLDVNYPGLCVLQKELSGPLTVCEHCMTGSSDCSDITDSSCSFVVGSDKTPVSSFMFTDSAGGKGSGLDLSSITLQKFSITPGVGGKAQGNAGGGGGGVLANGDNPNRASTNSGEGYGGGRGYESSDTDGPGLVLMEIIRRK